MAGPPGQGLHSPDPQGGPAGAREHPPAPGSVNGLQIVGGCALGGCHCVARVLGPPGGRCLPPSQGAVDGAAVTQVLLEMCRPRGWAVAGMSIDYIKCFDLIPGRSCWPWRWSWAWTKAGAVPFGACTSSSAGPSRSPWPSACGARPPMGMPLVAEFGEHAHHNLELGGGVPLPAGVCADGRPSPPFWTRAQRLTWRWGPHSPSRMWAPATQRQDCRAMRTIFR